MYRGTAVPLQASNSVVCFGRWLETRARSGLFTQMKSEVFRVIGKLALPVLHPIGLD
jgi:hypothetical protein